LQIRREDQGTGCRASWGDSTNRDPMEISPEESRERYRKPRSSEQETQLPDDGQQNEPLGSTGQE